MKTGFVTLQSSPDGAIIFSNHQYSQYEALAQYIYTVHYPPYKATSMVQSPEFINLKPIQSSPDKLGTKTVATALKPNFTYAVRDDIEITEYVVFYHFHGLGFGQQAYVGLGAKSTTDGKSPQVIVLKVYCRKLTRRFKEEDILQEIHKEGYLPGVPRICKYISEGPFVLSRVHTRDPVREACMISLATTGESLSMCRNVLQFFKAMYDLTEGLYLNFFIYIGTNIS